MESVFSCPTEEQPPALPAKQHSHRRLSNQDSSVGSDSGLLSPTGLWTHNVSFSDVFSEPADCHAASCPIHQSLDLVKHQVRCLSDGTPPPVPKKRLARTLSLPASHVPPLSPLASEPLLQMHPHNFDNPLYMLAPIQDTHFSEEDSVFGATWARPLLPLSELCFDTPDERLSGFFGSFKDQSAFFESIQQRHLLFLRDMAQKIEAKLQLQVETSEKPVSSYQPQDFMLDEGSEPKRVGETVYYSVHSPRFSGRTLGLRICKETYKPPAAHTKLQKQHVNVQNVVAHFQLSSREKSQDTAFVFNSGYTADTPPPGGSNEYANYSGSRLVCTVQHLLWKGHCVSIERDLPLATLEDFVQESTSLQNSDCLLYDKQVCLLMLQIIMGIQHVYNNSASVPELKARDILLVWPGIERAMGRTSGVNKEIKMKIMDQEDAAKTGHLQIFWKTLGCPRVVITSHRSALSVPQSYVSFKTQISALIQYCVNAQEGLAALYMSTYRKNLLYLASQIHKDNSGLDMNNMVSLLQVIVFGPSVPLCLHRSPGTSAVHNWLTVKRALLVMKLAEKGLDQGLDWEDCLCVQYLSFTEPETVVSATTLLESGLFNLN